MSLAPDSARDSELEQALRQARQGDLDAFESVIRTTARALRSYLTLFINEPGVIDDLMQECYLHVFEHLADYTPGTSFIAYLKTIGKFRALSHLRSSERKRSAHQRYLLAIHQHLATRSGEAIADADDAADDARRLARLHSCIASLASFARELIRLRYFEAHPIEAIAKSLGRTSSSINVAMFRARRHLAACLAQPGTPAVEDDA